MPVDDAPAEEARSPALRSSSLKTGVAAIRRRLFGELGPSAPPSRAEVAAVVVVCALAVPVLEWSRAYGQSHISDSLVPGLMSVQKLTWYYWGQNRLGNLLPFLASFVHDLHANFGFQVVLRGATALALPACAIVALRSYERLAAKYFLSLALTFGLLSPDAVYPLFIDAQPYAPSLALFTIAIGLFRGESRARGAARKLAIVGLAFVVVLAAFFVNASLLILVGPLLAGFCVVRGWRADWLSMAVTVPAWALAMMHSVRSAPPGASDNYMRLELTAENFRATLVAVRVGILPDRAGVIGALVVAAMAATALLQRRRQQNGILSPTVANAGAVLAAAAVYVVVVGCLAWTRINAHSPRYFAVVLPLAITVAVVLAVESLAVLPVMSSRGMGAAACGIFLAVFLPDKLPLRTDCTFIERYRIDEVEELAAVAERHDAAFFAGLYWPVWPAVFHTVRRRQAAHSDLPVFGLTARGEVRTDEITRHLRTAPRSSVICYDLDAEACLAAIVPFASFTAWPESVSRVEVGALTTGHRYEVLRFQREGAPTGAALPRIARALFRAQGLVPSSTRQGDDVLLPARSPAVDDLALFGPYVRLDPGRSYRIGYRLELEGDPGEHEVLKLAIVDAGSPPYFTASFRAGDLARRDDGTWATTTFTLPPHLRADNAMEFYVVSTGHVPVTLRELSLAEAPAP